jgi:hypothetical protein
MATTQSPPANTTMTTPVTSINNYLLANFATSKICITQSCVLSHRLAEFDRKNFGQQYSESSGNTNVFPRICDNCLVAKFGLFESMHKEEAVNYINCLQLYLQGKEGKQSNIEGPYLNAFKSVIDIVPETDVVFEEGTIIIPAGKLLIDLIMTETDILFNKTRIIPKIKLKHKYDIDLLTLTLNPYIYSYFYHLHDRLTLPDQKNKKPHEYKYFEDILCLDKKNDNECLDATFEIDALLMSNLINPLASTSSYVSEAKTIPIKEDKLLYVVLDQVDPINPPTTAELSSLDNSLYSTVEFKNEEFGELNKVDIKCVTKEKLQHFNSLLLSHIMGMKQLIVNRQLGLLGYFKKNDDPDDNIYSAIGLHIASFCFPSAITKNGTEIVRKVFPNVKWIEGIGLISTSNICQNELLVIDQSVDISDFIRLKMSNYEQSIKYSIPKININEGRENGRLSYDYEGRKSRKPKMCLYMKT